MINSEGRCKSCGGDFQGEQLEGQSCPATDDCPSHFEEAGKAHPDFPNHKETTNANAID